MKHKTNELVAYNANDPSLWEVVACDGETIAKDQFEMIKDKCRPGPYFGFFLCSDEYPRLYRFRGPFQGLENLYYAVDATAIQIDDTTIQIMDLIRKQVDEIKKNF